MERNHLGVGLATTAFLDSFGPDKVVGASVSQMFLGVGRPGSPEVSSRTCVTHWLSSSGTCATRAVDTVSLPSQT